MKIIKFGGTSLQTPTLVNNALEIIKNYQEKVIVVISAIGRKGFPYATDTLIDSLKEKHISDKEFDRLVSIGETYASVFLSNELNKNQIPAYSLSFKEIGINCNKDYSSGEILSVNCERIKSLLSKFQVLIVPGFLAKSSENEVISLGRGTSDFSAVVLADILGEKEVILYKDINGIYPTIQYPLVKLKCYENLSYQEMLSLCDIKIPIINKKAVEYAKDKNIDIIVKNFITNDSFTRISPIASNKKVIGFLLVNNQYYLATFYPDDVKNEIDDIFKKNHIFIKNYSKSNNYLSFIIASSQALLIRKIILKTYFSDLLR